MDQPLDLSTLEARQVDPEVFRRVWARVMPDQQNSPIEVDPPLSRSSPSQATTYSSVQSPSVEPSSPTSPAQETGPAFSSAVASNSKLKANPERQTAEPVLRHLMDLAQEGMMTGKALSRRGGNHARVLSALAADHQQALRKLSAAYFLETGRRYQPRTGAIPRNSALSLALREQFLWEQRLAKKCLQAGELLEDPSLRELCHEMAQDSALHNRTIRSLLERM